MAQQKYDVFREFITAKIPQNAETSIAHRLGKKPNRVILLETDGAIANVDITGVDADVIKVTEGNVSAPTIKLLVEYFHSVEGDVGTSSVDLTAPTPVYTYADGQGNFSLQYKIDSAETYAL